MRRATDVGFTLVERIAQWEREYGANIAVRDRETTYTYTELFDAARRFASCLASEGIEAGDFLHPQRNAVSLRKYSSRCKCKTTSW